jgi:hypothetical protein
VHLTRFANSIAANVAGFLLSLMALLVVAPGASGTEEPLLLAQTENLRSWSTWTPAWTAPTVTGVQFYLSYPDVALPDAIGGELILTNGQVGVFDFAATNSRAFSGFAARLTDPVQEMVIQGYLVYDSERFVWEASTQLEGESYLWASPRNSRVYHKVFPIDREHP